MPLETPERDKTLTLFFFLFVPFQVKQLVSKAPKKTRRGANMLANLLTVLRNFTERYIHDKCSFYVQGDYVKIYKNVLEVHCHTGMILLNIMSVFILSLPLCLLIFSSMFIRPQ